ncbi:SDR family NAD(P)-dependent oxidoreductase [Caballeronia sordidicola]|nr:SDR family oxidoreductase [Caballeronia sordidicola]
MSPYQSFLRNSMTLTTPSTVLITGASSGIGATYAERFAKRGHNLVLVARDLDRLEQAAARLRSEHGVSVDVLKADLTEREDLAHVERRLQDDDSINILINNAGATAPGGFQATTVDQQEFLIQLHITAVMRLSSAVVKRFVANGAGTIVNISSVLALAPEYPLGVYSATKAFVLTYSQSLHAELNARGVYVQAVMPAATRTEIWERAGHDIAAVQGLMEVAELVDAALVGFDRRELITIPPLPDAQQWLDFDAARQAMLPNFGQQHAAERYQK